jgi:hypothetical protein
VTLRKPSTGRQAQGYKAVRKPPNEKQGRKSGNSVVYDPVNLFNYPLQIPRYEKGSGLIPLLVADAAGKALTVQQIAALRIKTNFTIGEFYTFRYETANADKGYWTVRFQAYNRTGSYPPWLQSILALQPGGSYAPPPVALSCDCPDFDRQDYRYFSKFGLEVGGRDWSSKKAGCDRVQGCKHVYATKIYLQKTFIPSLPFEGPALDRS